MLIVANSDLKMIETLKCLGHGESTCKGWIMEAWFEKDHEPMIMSHNISLLHASIGWDLVVHGGTRRPLASLRTPILACRFSCCLI